METPEKMKEAAKSTARALKKEAAGEPNEPGHAGVVAKEEVEAIIRNWPETPQKVAKRTMDKYGPPSEATESMLLWYNNGPWKRTVVSRYEVPHNFPKPHTDLLEQFINYKVPPEKASDLATYDGSVIIERTKGEVSARCDMEEMNFLALNLMHEIASGKRSVDEARKVYAETAVGFMMGRPSPYTDGFTFEVPQGGTADVDKTLISEAMMNQTKEKLKDMSQRH